ncbi:tetratricopeptide repeat protein [Marivita sp.]|jgi:tetratricopeptide (TPR) repeat protein|uniref:tetratricopeptide repeat protein n=1 Tax=Marivita sp. TaxID=2003365 RepID=UPI003F6F1C5B
MRKYKSAVAAFIFTLSMATGPLSAQDDPVESLMDQLAQAEDEQAAGRLERQLRQEWSKSGSATIDLLLKRGQDALDVDDVEVALEHLTALTDHAPDFAEGWHTLALAYYREEKFGPAADALERTLALNPNHFGAMRGLGAILEQVDKPHLAYDAYSRVLTLRPHDSDVIDALERLELRVNGQTI